MSSQIDFSELRKEYETRGIDESELADDPLAMFRDWFQSASDSRPGEWFEPNAMTLATADRSGAVSARIVLLKAITDTGIRFFTNYESAKGKQLAVNPQASAVFHWPWQGRQVRLSGAVEKVSREDSEAYFHQRPRGAQIGAVVSQQSSEITSRQLLDKQRQLLEKEFAGQSVPLPDNWGGYEIQLARVEFWQGRLDRLHDRVEYRQVNGAWQRCRLAP